MNIYRTASMAKELILGWSGGLICKIPLSVSIPFHVDSLNQTSLQGLRFIHPDQKLLYLFTPKCVLLKVNQSESEFILVCVHAPYWLLFRWGLVVGQADLKKQSTLSFLEQFTSHTPLPTRRTNLLASQIKRAPSTAQPWLQPLHPNRSSHCAVCLYEVSSLNASFHCIKVYL